jgi:hypothetical protein
MSFQSQVNIQPAPACAGDFASANPRAVLLAGPGAVVAGSTGVNTGVFAWVLLGVALNSGTGAPSGMVRRNNEALITTFLAESGTNIPQGLPLTVYTQGDFWVQNTVAVATVGQKVFASLTTGQVQTAAAGATVAGYIETKWFVASPGAVGELIKITTWG